jgi:hypothetical protein
MAGLVPAIHVFVCRAKEDMDGRHKALTINRGDAPPF